MITIKVKRGIPVETGKYIVYNAAGAGCCLFRVDIRRQEYYYISTIGISHEIRTEPLTTWVPTWYWIKAPETLVK